jgi:hypothetical protein
MAEILNIDIRKDMEITDEKRGIHVVKEYLHIHGNYKGEKVFCKFRRKHNRTREEVMYHQFIVEEIKKIVGLQGMGTRMINDVTEGYGVMLNWHDKIGHVKEKKVFKKWVNKYNLMELLKIVFFDAITGGLDRHGGNIIVLPNTTLMSIDDEDVFYDAERRLIKMDKTLRDLMWRTYVNNKPEFDEYVKSFIAKKKEILACADYPIMKPVFYDILKKHLNEYPKLIEWIEKELQD